MKDIVTKVLEWLFDVLTWLPEFIFEKFVDAAIYAYDLLPTPDFVQNADGYFNALPAGLTFFLGVFEFDFLFGVIIAAYIARWTKRLIPFVGK